jgi:hypothetical protein
MSRAKDKIWMALRLQPRSHFQFDLIRTGNNKGFPRRCGSWKDFSQRRQIA